MTLRLAAQTGVVLSGPRDTSSGEPSLTGPALGEASELEHRAPPWRLLVGAETWRLIDGRFLGEPIEPEAGEESPVVVLGQVGEDVSSVVTATPMLGRDAELALLRSCLEEAQAGQSRAVLILGEAGIGKSRLAAALRQSIDAGKVDWLDCRCSPYFRRSSFQPLFGLIRGVIRGTIGPASSDRLRAQDVAVAAEALGLDPEMVPLIESLLSIPVSTPEIIEGLSPQLRRERTIAALAALLHHRAAVMPVVLVVEDLHWADPSTLEFLDRLSGLHGAPLLTLLTARPDFSPSWSRPTAIVPIQLRRLPPATTAQLVAQIAAGRLSDQAVDQLVRKTDGIPLFVEELTRLMLEMSARSPGELQTDTRLDQIRLGSTPTTLLDSLTARLDRLGPARELAQFGAALGPEFEVDDLREIWRDALISFDATLRELVRAEILQPRGLPPHRIYAFRHALLRDAAYDSLPREVRRDVHARIARSLAARSSGSTTRPELLAHHFAEAGFPREAAGLLLQAGQSALERSANAEARGHFQRGIDLIGSVDQSPADASLDITLRTLKGMAWVVSLGYGVPEVEASFSGAIDRLRLLGQDESPALMPAMWAQWVFALVRGRFTEAMEISGRLMRLADRVDDPGVVMRAHLAHGTSLFGFGRPAEAEAHLAEGLRHYDPVSHATDRHIYGQDPFMFGSVFRAWALWTLGFPDSAATLVDQAVSHAEGLRHPNSLGFALALAAIIHQYRGDADAVDRVAGPLRRLSTEQGWLQWGGHALLWTGAAAVLRGHHDEALPPMREARRLADQIGERSGASHYDAVLIDGLLNVGALDEAEERLRSATSRLAEASEFVFEAELLRLEGELFRRRGDLQGARSAILRALDSAAARSTRSYELRRPRPCAARPRTRERRGPCAARRRDGNLYRRRRHRRSPSRPRRTQRIVKAIPVGDK